MEAGWWKVAIIPTAEGKDKRERWMWSEHPGSAEMAAKIAAIAALLVAIIAAIASYTAAYISHRTKISEFRQKWIDELRNDIAEYLEKVFEGCVLKSNDAHKKRMEAMIIMRRIEMRFKPDEDLMFRKRSDIEDSIFLRKLRDLPAEIACDDRMETWNERADQCMVCARRLLKREWEVTKKFT